MEMLRSHSLFTEWNGGPLSLFPNTPNVIEETEMVPTNDSAPPESRTGETQKQLLATEEREGEQVAQDAQIARSECDTEVGETNRSRRKRRPEAAREL